MTETETEKEFNDSVEKVGREMTESCNSMMAAILKGAKYGCMCQDEKECIHWTICRDLHDTYKAKNADYGDSFAMVRNKYPNAILIRLNDKLNRLETLMNGVEQHVNDESIEDTLLDLANYCIMELVERRHNDGIIRNSEISE